MTRACPALLAAAALACLPAPAMGAGDGRPAVTILIDDLGNGLSAGRRVVRLPGPVVCAVLPHTPRAELLANMAFEAGKEVLLHLPLQPLADGAAEEPGEIVLDMTEGELARTFAASLAAVPHAIGVNTHQGSLLTRHPGHMSWLMQAMLAEGDLVFVDSYTTPKSIALGVARESGVPAVRRDVFLDPDPAPATVAREFARLKRLASSRGMAVAIGHPHPATLALLERELPRLEDEGFRLVGIRDYLRLAGQRGREGNPERPRALQATVDTTKNTWRHP